MDLLCFLVGNIFFFHRNSKPVMIGPEKRRREESWGGRRYFNNIPTNPQFSGLATQSGQNSWKRKFGRPPPPPPALPGTLESPRNPSNNLLTNNT